MRCDSGGKSLAKLWREFLPLSLSDVVMAVSDPLTTLTVSHLPAARASLAALGVAKPMAVFFESPVIMLLHASNSLASAGKGTRRSLWRLMVLDGILLTAGLATLAVPAVFDVIGRRWLGLSSELLATANQLLLLFLLWPAASGWRRYYQGLLIHQGFSRDVGRASVFRLFATAGLLATGFLLGLPGWITAGVALLGGIVVEAATVTIVACLIRNVATTAVEGTKDSPRSVGEVWRFYRPLASSMVVVWGSRALLVTAIAHSIDSELALAAWPAAWGLVVLVANATRMVQQVIIRHRKDHERKFLLGFAGSVGLSCSLFLAFLAGTAPGESLVSLFAGNDVSLVERIRPVLIACAVVPLLVALQNALQGFLIGEGRTGFVNRGAWIGATILLVTASLATALGMPGALAAGVAMLTALIIEVTYLGFALPKPQGEGYEARTTHDRGRVLARQTRVGV